jgi:toluene monooxygenase system ferredoxin subunit
VTFRRAAALDEIWSGDMLGCEVAGRKVLLVRVEESVFAYEDRCAHLGVPLSRGRLAGTRLTCYAHEWQYDVATGRGINPASACLRAFPVRVDGGLVLVNVEGA